MYQTNQIVNENAVFVIVIAQYNGMVSSRLQTPSKT